MTATRVVAVALVWVAAGFSTATLYGWWLHHTATARAETAADVEWSALVDRLLDDTRGTT